LNLVCRISFPNSDYRVWKRLIEVFWHTDIRELSECPRNRWL